MGKKIEYAWESELTIDEIIKRLEKYNHGEWDIKTEGVGERKCNFTIVKSFICGIDGRATVYKYPKLTGIIRKTGEHYKVTMYKQYNPEHIFCFVLFIVITPLFWILLHIFGKIEFRAMLFWSFITGCVYLIP